LIVLDTSGMLAAVDSDEPLHTRVSEALRAASPPLILSPFVLAELDYLLATRIGTWAQTALLEEVARGAYALGAFGREDVVGALSVIRRYADLGLSLADASIVVLARRHETRDVLTLDERHFRVVRAHRGRPFRLWPADAP
jgi:predicted nucleic acid-binding protein